MEIRKPGLTAIIESTVKNGRVLTASQGYAVCAAGRQPVCIGDNFRCQLDTPFSNIQTFVINPALPADDIHVATGNSGRHEPALEIDRLFKTAESAAFAGFFPGRHCCGHDPVWNGLIRVASISNPWAGGAT